MRFSPIVQLSNRSAFDQEGNGVKLIEKVVEMPHVLDRFVALKQEQFTGQLEISSESESAWVLYFFLGRLLYGTGGKHPIRRLYRHLETSAQLTTDELSQLQSQFTCDSEACREYEFLSSLVKRAYLTPEKIPKVISGILSEIFFELTYFPWERQTIQSKLGITKQLGLVDPVRLLDYQQTHWKPWQIDQFRITCLNQAFAIRDPKRLQQRTSADVYQRLMTTLNGSRTLWDLVAVMRRDPTEVLRSLLPYLQSGVIELIDIPDLPGAVPSAPIPRSAATESTQQPLIACVDDSAWVCQTLEKVVKAANYRFLAIQDPLRAIPSLLVNKPQLILLDLRMPNTNGYEICSQLRRISAFSETPIIILTGNDGFVDRVRAKLVGATDFLSKAVSCAELMAVLNKYLLPNEASPLLLHR